MPEMDTITKLSMVALVGVLLAALVLYHVWLDRRLARASAVPPARDPEPPAGAERCPRKRPDDPVAS